MKAVRRFETVSFTTKGQVVIPQSLRRQYEIAEGTKAIVSTTPEGILLQPVTAAVVRQGYGILRRPPGEPSLAEEWVEHKRREREREARRSG
jgi:AbrB family looped-hinge helix DNA binding protein